jgi:hypothetical protein
MLAIPAQKPEQGGGRKVEEQSQSAVHVAQLIGVLIRSLPFLPTKS